MSVKIFLSTVSDEFGRYRDQLHPDLTRHNVEVKVQEDFKDLGRGTLDELDTYIAACDAVVHLVGDMTGAAPGKRDVNLLLAKYSDLTDNLPPLGEALKNGEGVSYTQWESWLALYHNKDLFITQAAESAERGPRYAPTDVSRAAQALHLKRLRELKRYSGFTFTSSLDLANYLKSTGILDLLAKAYAEALGRDHDAAGRSLPMGAHAVITVLPGPIYAGLPDLPDGYRPREADFQVLKTLLINSNQSAGIVAQSRAAGLRGMGGVGKTVLATALVHDQDVRLAFPYGIVWLTFGRSANASAQLAVLARAVTGQLAAYASVAEARTDLGRLLKDLRLLIVLDDVWDPRLVDGFRGIAPGCHLLITTRQQAVVERANARAHEVGVLNSRETRALLMEALGTADLPLEAEAVIAECGGLPLAIAAAAGMVRRSNWTHTRDAFTRARLDALKTTWLPDSEQQNLEIVLAASVQTLPDQERTCFLECVIWPEDVAVSISALRLFWSEHVPDEFDQREVADALTAASVLQRGGGETVRLHALYHDYLRHVIGNNFISMQGAFADRCVRFSASGCELLDRSAWTLEHLPWHLVQAGRQEQAKVLQLDRNWLVSKLAMYGVQSLIANTHLMEKAWCRGIGIIAAL